MYSPSKFGADSYARIGLETSVNSASPYELVALLFQGARRAIRMGRVHMQNGNIPEKGKLISQAIVIVGGGLQQGLNLEQGGDLAQRLNALYDYMTRRLLEANVRNDPALLDEIDSLLATIEDGWNGIKPELKSSAGLTQLTATA
ncbi:flagellar protein FliS [Paraburkholderia phytofirmans OLGA172]|uniref:Flagellar secretion chaperone FliS n=1 Tax=Paraburkholderia phytofirmans OLGA172 TaxID=1417228 RepID=A0A160FP75_9BURK|nr:flagellar export chaperone FliS [Paraburkholderia phytofirmans]ANB74364.1 flagellar protein FliS [Paraburkholderia phytofirmans OLGA172]